MTVRRRCELCPMWLTDPVSIRRGYGPTCAKKLGQPPQPITIHPAAPVAGQLALEDHMPDTVTDRPYTDADLRTEAARQHAALTAKPDLHYVGMQMVGIPIASRADERRGCWHDLDDIAGDGVDGRDTDPFGTAQRAVNDLMVGAADTSEWAVQLGAAGLEPHPSQAWMCAGVGYELAVQVATSPDLKAGAREELLREIRAAVDATVRRVLNRQPA
ncbi:DUF6011 domain-containing protein [Streptomyces sp. N2-109]|uniref:DUF6011 domain-containing protein n=1 Tax=Streptomyces gossypii TaxID=2883101 RepID=A0ABT2JT96_9ACTN|nr:DUF6011 domain-containing protein [Streptomyces gossypii]MCT2591107.1 DUF6011 domain-containing protein [Streptomyces gossypii]